MSLKRACAYCGKRSDKRDKEHVFPRNLYPLSKTRSKIQRLTIPACKSCNNSWSDDEVHFRNVLVLTGDPTTTVKKELWATTISRSFSQIDGFRRIKDLLSQMKTVSIEGQNRYIVYPGNDPRVVRVVRKIVKGLCYYHNIISPLREERIFVDVLKFKIPDYFLEGMEFHDRDRDIVEYRFQVLNEQDLHSAWLITFFQTVTFIGLVTMTTDSL